MKHLVAIALVVAAVAVAGACNSNNGPTGGVVLGAVDRHCTLPDGGNQVQPTDPAACHPDGGMVTTVDYGPTLYNAEADDDDCKYHLAFTVTSVQENHDVDFTVVATRKRDGAPAAGAKTSLEIFLSETHPAPNSNQRSTEGPAGTYKIGPVRFDAQGQWTVRFHLYEECSELLITSPHGHGAFYIWVP